MQWGRETEGFMTVLECSQFGHWKSKYFSLVLYPLHYLASVEYTKLLCHSASTQMVCLRHAVLFPVTYTHLGSPTSLPLFLLLSQLIMPLTLAKGTSLFFMLLHLLLIVSSGPLILFNVLIHSRSVKFGQYNKLPNPTFQSEIISYQFDLCLSMCVSMYSCTCEYIDKQCFINYFLMLYIWSLNRL